MKMTNFQINNAISLGIIFAIWLPMFIHLVNNAKAGVNGPDLIYQIIYFPLGLYAIWAGVTGNLHWQFFEEKDGESSEKE